MGRLTLIRHGQAGRWPDDYDRLSSLGEVQARRLGEHWAALGQRVDRAFIGPRRRHKLTHDVVADAYRARGLPWPEPTLLPHLDEFPAEEIVTRLLPMLAARDPEVADWLARLGGDEPKPPLMERLLQRAVSAWSRAEVGSPEIESWRSFQGRVGEALAEMTRQDGRGEWVLAFTSGGPLAVATGLVLETPDPRTLELIWQVRNSGLVEILFTKGRHTLRTFNDVAHLRGDGEVTYR